MITRLVLLIYASVERQLRLDSENKGEMLFDKKVMLTSTPSIRRVFQTFEAIDILSIWVKGQRTARQVLNLRPAHQQIVRFDGIQKRYRSFLDS